MRTRRIDTPQDSWLAFDEFTAGDDTVVPGPALQEVGPGEKGLAEWNARKAAARAAGEPVLVRVNPIVWTRERVLAVLLAGDSGGLSDLQTLVLTGDSDGEFEMNAGNLGYQEI